VANARIIQLPNAFISKPPNPRSEGLFLCNRRLNSADGRLLNDRCVPAGKEGELIDFNR
jgi:hypothetical protein